jgi:Na+/H+ antiporter NhaD/arsenite permease-like protein
VGLLEQAELPIRPYLFAIAAGANVGGVMTVVGNPQNMIIAHVAPLSYVAFARVLAPVGLVDLGVTVVLLGWIFRGDLRAPLSARRATPRPCLDRPLLARTVACLVAVVIAFVVVGNLAWTALAGATVLLAISGRSPRTLIAEVDGPLLLFFSALFVIVAGLDTGGVLARASTWLIPLINGAGLSGIVNFSWVTVLGSNVVSNVPYVLMAGRWIAPGAHHLWLLLALTSTLAGNLTVFGSAANVIVFESARDHVHIGFWEFLRIGIPITVVTTLVGVALLLALM